METNFDRAESKLTASVTRAAPFYLSDSMPRGAASGARIVGRVSAIGTQRTGIAFANTPQCALQFQADTKHNPRPLQHVRNNSACSTAIHIQRLAVAILECFQTYSGMVSIVGFDTSFYIRFLLCEETPNGERNRRKPPANDLIIQSHPRREPCGFRPVHAMLGVLLG